MQLPTNDAANNDPSNNKQPAILAAVAELNHLRARLAPEPQQELQTLLTAPRHLLLIDPTARFTQVAIYLPAPRVWPDVLMDEWVLENINTMASRIAVPSLVWILALERATGSLCFHACDLALRGLEELRSLAATDPLMGQPAEQAWQQLSESRHYASFNPRHAYTDPELRMRVSSALVAVLLPGVDSGSEDAVFEALAGDPLDTLLSPLLPISLITDRGSGLALASLHAQSWIEESTNWVTARTSEIRAAGGHYGQTSAALTTQNVGQCADPLQCFDDAEGNGLVCEPALRTMRALSPCYPEWGTLPAYHWLNASGRRDEQARRIDQVLADPVVARELLLNWVQVEGSHSAGAAFLRAIAADTGDGE